MDNSMLIWMEMREGGSLNEIIMNVDNESKGDNNRTMKWDFETVIIVMNGLTGRKGVGARYDPSPYTLSRFLLDVVEVDCTTPSQDSFGSFCMLNRHGGP